MKKHYVTFITPNGVFEVFRPDVEEELKKGGCRMEAFNKVKSFRVGANITQEAMADLLGMSRKTYRAKEDGSIEWKMSEMSKFVDAINKATGSEYTPNDIFF